MIIDLDENEAHEFFIEVLGATDFGEGACEFDLTELDEETIVGWLDRLGSEITFKSLRGYDIKCLENIIKKFEDALIKGGKEYVFLRIFEEMNK